MKIGLFKCSEAEFSVRGFNTKFNYHEPIQVVGAVASGDGLRYLTIKHHIKDTGYAQFGWFSAYKFQCFAEGFDIETLKAKAENNRYYWIHEEQFRIYESTDKKSKSKISKLVLTRFEEDDE